jgi:hypothetical protein
MKQRNIAAGGRSGGQEPANHKRTVPDKCHSENLPVYSPELGVIYALSLEFALCLELTLGHVARIDGGIFPSVISMTCWRREWDSNPRYSFPHTRFPSVRLKPLGHLSGCPLLKRKEAFCK